MFDQTSIVYGLCRQWIQQGHLTERLWLQIQEQHRQTQQELATLLLHSGYIDEDLLLSSISKKIGCHYWSGRSLLEEHGHKDPPSLPISLDYFAHKHVLPLSWSTTKGTLHLVMARLPSQTLLTELRALLPITKLHLELASSESVSIVLGLWSKRSSKITSVLDAAPVELASLLGTEHLADTSETPSSSVTQPLSSLAESMASFDPVRSPASSVAATQNAQAFDPEAPNHGALGSMKHSQNDGGGDINQTYAILPIAPIEGVPTPPKRRVIQNTPTMEAAPPLSYPSTPTPPPDTPTQADLDGHSTTHRLPSGDLTYADPSALHSPSPRLPSGDLAFHAPHASAQPPDEQPKQTPPPSRGFGAVDDSEFFLDYQNPNHTAPVSSQPAPIYVPHDESGAPPLPTAQGNEKLEDFADFDELVPAPTTPPVLELSEVLPEPTPMPTTALKETPVPTPAPTPVPPPSTPILPSDEELFGTSLRPDPIKSAPAPLPRSTSRISPAPQISTKSRRTPDKKTQKKRGRGFDLEEFLLRYVLGGAVGLVNMVVRFGLIFVIGYFIWYFFLST